MKIRKLAAHEWVIVVGIAFLLAWLVSSQFKPLSDDELQRIHYEQTQGLPQDR